ncbi:UNKNOWN [Stylonychia lemnae]|uniref:TFA2 Winged helix domain-containing protein n=1 Tax=Stylonychia lemnae TaxID=5949 RepID=A0A077ZYI7_STYLE|nr:UNKNOWN [Stylonychia lemnae]|eukprot:CDW74677.1 UNKNOWN [Stylonychia lemnae]
MNRTNKYQDSNRGNQSGFPFATQQPQSYNKPLAKDITFYQTTYSELRKLLTQKRAPVSLKDAQRVNEQQFIEYIQNNPKEISYDEYRKEFVFQSKYGIKNKEDLKNLLVNNPEGIREDDDLRECYRGLEEDLEDLKNLGWVRVVKVQRDQILFPINKNESHVEVRHNINPKISNMLSDIWQNLEGIEDFKYENILLENNLLSQFEKEQLTYRQRQRQALLEKDSEDQNGMGGPRRMRRAKKQMNDHIDINFLDVL